MQEIIAPAADSLYQHNPSDVVVEILIWYAFFFFFFG